MAVTTGSSRLQATLVAAGEEVSVPLRVNRPEWVELYYGASMQKAVYGVDYMVDVNGEGTSISVVPLAPLFTKLDIINASYDVWLVRNTPIDSDFTSNEASINR